MQKIIWILEDILKRIRERQSGKNRFITDKQKQLDELLGCQIYFSEDLGQAKTRCLHISEDEFRNLKDSYREVFEIKNEQVRDDFIKEYIQKNET